MFPDFLPVSYDYGLIRGCFLFLIFIKIGARWNFSGLYVFNGHQQRYFSKFQKQVYWCNILENIFFHNCVLFDILAIVFCYLQSTMIT